MFSGRPGMSIFNRRRRPRQAVYASPQSQSQSATITIKTEEPDKNLSDVVHDFDTGHGNFNFVSDHKPATHYSNTFGARSWETRHIFPQKHPKNQHNNENIQPKFENTYFGVKQNNGISSEQQKATMNTETSWQIGNSSNRVERQQTFASKGFRYDKNSVKQHSQPGHNHFSWSNTNSSPRATTTGNTARQKDHKASFETTQSQLKETKVEKPSDKIANSSGDTFTMRTVDKSMKFVTATIQGLRKWSKYREQVPLVFEIFATLDSVPTFNNNGTAKLFTVKDSTGVIRCIFWEMDHTLPRITRGQIYRLVGALERTTSHFQCFTIRQAQPVEVRFAPKLVTMCDNALTNIVSMIAEA